MHTIIKPASAVAGHCFVRKQWSILKVQFVSGTMMVMSPRCHPNPGQITLGGAITMMPVNSPHKGPVTRFFSFEDVIMELQYIPRYMHTVFALLCFVVVIQWLIFPYPSGLLHWHCGNLTIAPVPAKQPWWIWINTSCEFIMNDCITTTKQSTTKPCAYFLGYTVSKVTIDCAIPSVSQEQV